MEKTARSLGRVAFLIVLISQFASAGTSLWTYKSGSELKWHKLTSLGYLVAGGDEGLVCLDPDKGTVIWKRDDLKGITAYQAVEADGTPYLIISKNNWPSSTKVWGISELDGKDLWTTEKLKGATIGVYSNAEKDMVLILSSGSEGQSKVNPQMLAVQLSDGKTLWEGKYPEKVDLHQAEQKSRWSPHFDLNGHQPPVFDGDAIYFTFAGLHKFEAATGKVLWSVPYDVTEGRLRRGNAQLVIDGDMVYTSAKGQLRAIDKNTGQVKWTSPDFGAAVAEMQVRGDVLYGRMGGTFFDDKKMAYDLKKPLGVVGVNKATGAAMWKYDKMSDAITNMAILENQKALLVADKDELIGLNLDGGGEQFKVKVEFKNHTSGGQKAMKVARFGMGGLKGGLKGMSDDKKRQDVPINVVALPTGSVVIRGRQNIVGFNPGQKQISYASVYDPPGFSGWQTFAMVSVYAMSYAGNTMGAANTQFGSSSNNSYNNMRQSNLAGMSDALNKRFSATQSGKRRTYILTELEEGKEKGAGLIAINMSSGEEEGQILLRDKEPDYVVDDLTGHLYNLKDNTIQAYSIE